MPEKADERQPEEFVFEEWLAEGVKGVLSCLKREEVLPKEFKEHMRTAHREKLLAMRSLLDAAIERTEEKPKQEATEIEVE